MPRNSKSDRSNEHAHYPTLEVVPNTTAASCAVGLSAFLLREWLLADKRSRAQQEIRILVSCRGSVPSLSLVTWSLFCRARLADIAGPCLPSARKDVTARGCLLVSHWIVSRALGSDEDGTDPPSLELPCSARESLVRNLQKLQLTRGLLPETLRRRSSTALASVVSMQGVAMVSLPSCTTLNALDI